jgi:hypothetical protein
MGLPSCAAAARKLSAIWHKEEKVGAKEEGGSGGEAGQTRLKSWQAGIE